MLFSSLTVLEHLVFFGRLKGCSKAEAKEEGMKLLKNLNLIDKKSVTVTKLSGGMKRRLHLALYHFPTQITLGAFVHIKYFYTQFGPPREISDSYL